MPAAFVVFMRSPVMAPLQLLRLADQARRPPELRPDPGPWDPSQYQVERAPPNTFAPCSPNTPAKAGRLSQANSWGGRKSSRTAPAGRRPAMDQGNGFVDQRDRAESPRSRGQQPHCHDRRRRARRESIGRHRLSTRTWPRNTLWPPGRSRTCTSASTSHLSRDEPADGDAD